MLDLKNIPLYKKSSESVLVSSSKKDKAKHMDIHYDKLFLDNYFNIIYEGFKKK